jgi:hypothetical protein
LKPKGLIFLIGFIFSEFDSSSLLLAAAYVAMNGAAMAEDTARDILVMKLRLGNLLLINSNLSEYQISIQSLNISIDLGEGIQIGSIASVRPRWYQCK